MTSVWTKHLKTQQQNKKANIKIFVGAGKLNPGPLAS